MEGSGGHTKECKVRTTTSANPPVLAAAPSIPCFILANLLFLLLLFHLLFLLLCHRCLQPTIVSTSFFTGIVLLCRRLQRIIVQGGGSSPRLPLIVFHPRCSLLFLSLVVLTRSLARSTALWCCQRVVLQAPCSRTFTDKRRAPSSRRADHLKRPNDAERVFSPFALVDRGRHSSRIHEWSLVGRRIPRLRARSSTRPFDIKGGPLATLCISPVESV